MGRIKRWDGKNWNDYASFRRWNGKNWDEKPTFRRWDGKNWEVISQVKKVKTWTATWTRSFNQDSVPKSATGDMGRLYQGNDQTTNQGRQRSMIGFSSNIQEELTGSRIEKIELYLHTNWAWYWAGAIATIGVHNFASKPNRFNHTRYAMKEVRFNSRNQGMWITLDHSIGVMFAEGSIKGITLLKESDNEIYYGYWYGMNGTEAQKPKIRVTYYK